MITKEMIEAAVEARCEGAWLTMPEWLKQKERERMEAALTAALSSQWQPIGTAPEKTDILCWSLYADERDQFFVDRFEWREIRDWEIESESTNKSGRRQIRQERIKRERNWLRHWTPDFWMPLPPPPATQEGEK